MPFADVHPGSTVRGDPATPLTRRCNRNAAAPISQRQPVPGQAQGLVDAFGYVNDDSPNPVANLDLSRS